MKFYEAALKMEAGEIFKPDDNSPGIMCSDDGSFNLFDKGGALVMMSRQYLELEGKIIQAGPKVLTVDEWFEVASKDENICDTESLGYDGFEKGKKAGRLERDLEWKDSIKKFENSYSLLQPTVKSVIDDLLAEIQPLTKEKK